MYAIINDVLSDLRFGFQLAKLCLSTISIISICTQITGDCQVFVLVLNLYIFIASLLSLILNSNGFSNSIVYTTLTSNFIFLGVENVITLASFICMTSNTEDEMGLSRYEIVAISNGVLWGVHMNYITTTYIAFRTIPNQFEPYYDEFLEEGVTH